MRTLEQIRNELLTGAKTGVSPEERSGYIDGVLDMYNETRKEMDLCQAGKTQSGKSPNS